ncbi:MAG: hypothetical protein FD138_1873 [Planctomycetota bacterium]|nr:MAG: hypothetical protein FD138_1873 [Planctomycetota bacterium]
MVRILSDRLLSRSAGMGASGVLSLAMFFGGAAISEAGVRDLFSKSTSTSSAKATLPNANPRSAAISRLAANRKPGQLLAQTDAPLDRLKQRDAEQRFRDVLNDDDPFQGDASKPTTLPPKSAVKSKAYEFEAPRAVAEPAPIQPPEVRIATLPDEQSQPAGEAVPEPVTSPTQLKRISDIQPFFDYQPASAIKGEVCWDLCPRPDGMPCKPDENGNMPECPSEYKLSDAAYSNEAVQPFVSVAKFGVQLAGLPYQMTIDPVCKKMYNLGYYRVGECAPKKYYRIPWNTHAAVNEAAVWTGLIYLFP